MTGNGHLVSSMILAADTYAIHCFLNSADVPAVVLSVDHIVQSNIDVYTIYQDKSIVWECVFILLSVSFYLIGSLLPDIDLEHSMISKALHFHIPVNHRGLTHSIYIPIGIGCLGYFFFKPLLFLGLGILIHDFVDGFSNAGWVAFYPIGRYYVRNQIVISKRKHITLYSATNNGEFLTNLFLFMISAMLICFGIYFIAL